MKSTRHESVTRWLEDTTDEERLHRSWKRVAERRNASRSTHVRRVAVGATGLALAAAAALVVWTNPFGGGNAGPARTADGRVLPAVVPVRLDLADGSWIARSADARVTTLSNSADEVVFLQETGTTTFQVTPGGPRRWEVHTPLGVVRVVGTRFVVEVEPDSFRVSVQRGVVEVSSDELAGGRRRLTAGQSVRVTRTRADEASSEAPAPPRTESERVDALATEERASNRVATSDSPRARVSDEASERAAVTSIETASARRGPNPTEAPIEALSSEDLLARADAARRAHRPREAVAPLREVMQRRDANAGLAAFTLATLELEALAQPDQAAADFDHAVELGLTGRLEEEAIAHRAEALDRAGRSDEARRVRESYLSRYPDGRHAARIRALR